jgi:hypothetical protein
MSEEFVTEALNALRRADADVETGPETEIRALLAFRRQRRQLRSRRMAAWGAVAAAAAVLALAFLHRPAREIPRTVAVAEEPASPAAPPMVPTSPVKQAPAGSQEIVTDFFPLMESPPPFERGLLVRMTVPASTMRAVGLPVGDDHLSDPVQADVLVGQDDLARAIRFVSSRKIRD